MFRIRRGATASIAAGCGIALAALFAGAPSGVAAPRSATPQAAAPQVHVQTGDVRLVRSHGHVYRVEIHGRHGVIPMRGARGDAVRKQVGRAPADSTLIYNGGPVQHQVGVYLVFWGNQWDSDGNGVQQYQTDLFNGLGTSSDSWSTVTSQYTDDSGQGPSFGGPVLGGTWVDDSAPAPANAQQADIAAEADAAASHFGVSGPDVQIVVMSPSGTSPDGFPNSGFCAWHDYDGTVSYTNMPYVLDAGSSCGANSVANQLDGFSIVGGHEYAESLTDPQPSSGWVASDGEEDGDLCAWQNLGTISLPTGDFAMQPTWSNAAGGCAMSG
ncbi:hypothetical protein [Streptacidiphilus melanogenes]|uniref:hypothetical protein n=1 Tax=Streptacidiphilus melanogenes TaxID=411235 RepID=UPI0006942DA9|nr:hypothetical protein [Streptacidiphilus melanogenes]